MPKIISSESTLALVDLALHGTRRVPLPYLKVPCHLCQAHIAELALTLRIAIGEIWNVRHILDHHIGVSYVSKHSFMICRNICVSTRNQVSAERRLG
jgi:hypothetical protein